MIVSGYLNSGELQVKQFIAANVLFVLSLFGANNLKRIATVSLALAVIIAAGTIQTYLAGENTAVVAVSTIVLFIYLALVAIRAMSNRWEAHLAAIDKKSTVKRSLAA